MESGKISDASITASSSYLTKYGPPSARLRRKVGGCAWLSASLSDPKKSWLQVDFGKKAIVTGVATQGSCTASQWVKSYFIWYSDDAANWKYYKEEGAKKVRVSLDLFANDAILKAFFNPMELFKITSIKIARGRATIPSHQKERIVQCALILLGTPS